MKLIYFSPKLSAIYYGFAGVFFVLQIANSYQITDLRYWIDIICIILFGIVPPLILFIKATIPTPSAAGVAYIIVWAIIILLTSNLLSIIAWILNLIIAGIGLYVLIRVSVGKSVNICCCKFMADYLRNHGYVVDDSPKYFEGQSTRYDETLYTNIKKQKSLL